MRRETGKEQMVRVHYSEGIANRIDLESCAVHREVSGEALTKVCAGRVIEPRKFYFRMPTLFPKAEGNTCAHAKLASVRMILRGRRPWHVPKLFVREPGDLRVGHERRQRRCVVRIGKVRSRSR